LTVQDNHPECPTPQFTQRRFFAVVVVVVVVVVVFKIFSYDFFFGFSSVSRVKRREIFGYLC